MGVCIPISVKSQFKKGFSRLSMLLQVIRVSNFHCVYCVSCKSYTCSEVFHGNTFFHKSNTLYLYICGCLQAFNLLLPLVIFVMFGQNQLLINVCHILFQLENNIHIWHLYSTGSTNCILHLNIPKYLWNVSVYETEVDERVIGLSLIHI